MKADNKTKERPKYNLWQNSAYMIRLAWRMRKSVVLFALLLAVLAIFSNLANLYVTPVLLQKVEAAVPLAELLFAIAAFTGILLLLAALKAYIEANTLFGRVEVRGALVCMISNKLATTSLPNTEDVAIQKQLDKAGDAVSSNDQATEAVWNTLTDLVTNIGGFIIYLFLLSALDAVILGAVLLTAVTGYFVSKHINSWGYRHREEQAVYSKKMNYILRKSENIALAKDIRIFGMRPWLEGVYNSTLRLYEDFLKRREKVYLCADVVDIVLSIARNGIAYVYLISKVLSGGLGAAEFLLYFTAVGGFTAWVTGILNGFSTLHRQSMDLSTVREYLEGAEPFKFEDGKPLKKDMQDAYRIELKNVSFRYTGAEKDTLHGLSLTIGAGEKLAIVGLNGAGKTTLVKLVCGFYDPTEGEVLLNGQDIRQYNRRDYYALFSAVFQQFSLLEVTLEENVAQAVTGIDSQKVAACIEKAGLTQKVESLPAKYQTHIGRQVFEDGIELSGGETQRLMLARALYKDAPILVLDEPTAALDPLAEHDLYMKYSEMTAGRTAVYISHRLASTRFCDRIIFLSGGAIAEEGTHAELLKQGGKYAELFHIQSRYYQEGRDFDAGQIA